MKNLFKIVLGAGIAFTLASCGTMNDPYGNSYPNQYPQQRYPQQYPNDGGVVYRAPDGGIFRQGEIYRDRNGNVYQNGRVIRTGDVYGQPGVLGRNGGIMYPGSNPRNLPPGQAKKIYGGKATDYAPGQVKKRQGQYQNQQGPWRNDDRRWDDDRYENGKVKHQNKKFKNNKKQKNRWDD